MTKEDKPNVLIITTHDSGRHFGCYGAPTVRTPHIDQLASEGLLFENMFSTAPICSPSRGSMLTGQYPLANGLVGIAGGEWNWEFKDYRRHLSWILRDAGYRTAMIGLQHETSHINRLGFEDVSAHGVGTDDHSGALMPGWPSGSKGLSAEAVAQGAASFLKSARNDDRPFYAQVGFFETHTPFDYAGCQPDDTLGVHIPPFALGRGVHKWATTLNRFVTDQAFARGHIAAFQGSLAAADRAIGIILDALRETGQDENTIVLFNTDHGAELPGSKWTLYDPGIGVAFIMRWPAGGACGGRRCPWLLNNTDFFPTLLDCLQIEPPAELDGVSFAAALRDPDTTAPSPREAVYASWVDGLNFCVRTRRHKLIRNLFPEEDSEGQVQPPHELYDLELDPLERTNLAEAASQAQTFSSMRGMLDDWLAMLHDPSLEGLIHAPDIKHAVAQYRRSYERRSYDL